MPLPQALRRATPDGLRNDRRLRAIALGLGLIPPRTMSSPGEMELLSRLAAGASRVVELGVYEGSSAVVLCRVLGPDAQLHLVDPFLAGGWALRDGWGATPAATKLAVWRASRQGGPDVHWHVARSQDVGRVWHGGPVDLLFIDGDHSYDGCRADWNAWHEHVSDHGAVVFHDARDGASGGGGVPGPTRVVDETFRTADAGATGWAIEHEIDSMVAVRRAG